MKLTFLGKIIVSLIFLFSLFPHAAAGSHAITEAVTFPNMINSARSKNVGLEEHIFTRSQSVIGELKAIAILVDFPDKRGTLDIEIINRKIFVEMNSYFQEVSYNLIFFSGFTTAKWYTLPHEMTYYGAGDVFQEKHWDLAKDSITAADLDTKYENGLYIFIVYAGRDQAFSHQDNDISPFGYWDPLIIKTGEGDVSFHICEVSEEDPVGVFAHEAGHMLGLPDLYDYNYEEDFVGPWSLMASGFLLGSPLGSHPSHLETWSKIKLGWIPPSRICVVKLGEATTVVLHQIETSTTETQAIKVPITGYLYYLVEVRQKILFDSELPDHGVLITLCDETKKSGEGPVRVQDAHSLTASLHDATFDVGIQETSKFENKAHGIIVHALSKNETSYMIRVSYAIWDSDGDGLSDKEEASFQTDPRNPDTDIDGLDDYKEILIYHTNPLGPDTDRDGIGDWNEITYGTDPLKADSDGDYWNDSIDWMPNNWLVPNGVIALAIVLFAGIVWWLWEEGYLD